MRKAAIMVVAAIVVGIQAMPAHAFFCDIICLLQRYPVIRVDKVFDLKDLAQKTFDLKSLYPDLFSMTDTNLLAGKMNVSWGADAGNIFTSITGSGDVNERQTSDFKDTWAGASYGPLDIPFDDSKTPRQRVSEFYESRGDTGRVPGFEAEMVRGVPGVAGIEIVRGGRFGGGKDNSVRQPYAVKMYTDEARSKILASIAEIMAETSRDTGGGIKREMDSLKRLGDDLCQKVSSAVSQMGAGNDDGISGSEEVLDAKLLENWALLLASESGVRDVNNLLYLYKGNMMSRKIRMAGLVGALHTYDYANFMAAHLNEWIALQRQYNRIYNR